MSVGPADGRAYSRVYHAICSNQLPTRDESVLPWSYQSDTLFFNGSLGGYIGNPVLISDPMPMEDIVGFRSYFGSGSPSRFPINMKPVNLRYSWDADSRRYGSLLGTPGFIARVSHREADVVERGVRHAQYQGLLGESDWGSTFGPIYSLPNGVDATVPTLAPLSGTHFDVVDVTGYNSWGHPTYRTGVAPRDQDVTTLFDAFQLAKKTCDEYDGLIRVFIPGHGSSPFYNGATYDYLDLVGSFETSFNTWSVDITYTLHMWRGTPDNYAEYFIHINFDCGIRPAATISSTHEALEPVVEFWINDRSSVVAGQWALPEWVRDPIEVSGERFSIARLNQGFYYEVYQIGETFLKNFLTFHKATGNSRLTWLSQKFDQLASDIVPSSFLAATDALDTNISIINANLLQDLQHLKDILGLIPDLAVFGPVIARIVRGDPAAILELVDLLAEEILKARFQRDPLIKDTKELVHADLESKLGHLLKSNYRTIYGKFSYDFPDSENFVGGGHLRLETHAKIRVYFDIGTVMTGVLTANAVGLLPNLSRLWSLVPFSFVVDWFTNMSRRLHLVDDQVLYASLGINWCLWSYKLIWTPDADTLADFNLQSLSAEDPFSISVYQRDFSHWMPKLSDSRFDFLRRKSGPDPVTVGALVWTLLRGLL